MLTNQAIEAMLTTKYSRRHFVKQALTGLGTVAIGTFTMQVLASCAGPSPTGPSNNNDITLTVDLSLADNQTLNVIGGTLALSSNDLDNAGILLIRENNSSIKAFSRECTHNQCTIDAFSNGKSVCPCHGSEFNTSGSVIKGPATNKLNEYQVDFSGNTVTIS